MKKLILIAVSAIVAVSAGIFAYLNSESRSDEFFEANVEALADNEGTKYTCESNIATGDGNVFFCGTCNWVSGAKEAWNSRTQTCTR